MNQAEFEALLNEASSRAKSARRAIANLTVADDALALKRVESASASLYHDPQILAALTELSGSLSNSYLQIIADFEDEGRISWAGTAHEIRELLRKILEHLALAPDVEREPWFKQEPNVSGPTQKQRVRYILAKNNGDSKQQKVAQDIELVEDKIGTLVRDVYGRASDAAHRSKNKSEAFKILHYFQAFAYDLLNIG